MVSGLLVTRFGHAKVFFVGAVLLPCGFIVSFFARSIPVLCIFIGIMSGVGISFTYISSAAAFRIAFTGRIKIMSLTLHSASIGLGGFVYPYLLRYLLTKYGLNGTYLLIGGLLLHNVPFSIIIAGVKRTTGQNYKVDEKLIDEETNNTNEISKHYPHIENETEIKLESLNGNIANTTEDESEEKLLQKKEFRILDNAIAGNVNAPSQSFLRRVLGVFTLPVSLIAVGLSLAVGGINGYQNVVLDIFVWKGFSIDQGLSSFSVFHLSSIIARLIPGIVKQKKGISSLVSPIVAIVCTCIGQTLIWTANSYVLMMIGAALQGVGLGGVVSSVYIVYSKIVRESDFTIAFGLFYTIDGLMSMCAGPLFAALRDLFGSYSVPMAIGIILSASGLVLISVAAFVRKRQQRSTLQIA